MIEIAVYSLGIFAIAFAVGMLFGYLLDRFHL